MTAAQKAKELGAQSLTQVADIYGCSPQNLSHMYRNNLQKFEVIVLGAVAKAKLMGD